MATQITTTEVPDTGPTPVPLGDTRDHAWDLAYNKHWIEKGQTDKDGRAYWLHLAAVWQNVIDLGGDIEEQCAAILHDIVEDTNLTVQAMRDWHMVPVGDQTDATAPKVLTEYTVDMIEALTKRSMEPNVNYISRVIAAGPGAMRVKLADLYHNTQPDRLATQTEYTQDRLRFKYYAAITRIEDALGLPRTLSEAEMEEAQENHSPSSWSSSSGFDTDSRGYRLMAVNSAMVGDVHADHGAILEKTVTGATTTLKFANHTTVTLSGATAKIPLRQLKGALVTYGPKGAAGKAAGTPTSTSSNTYKPKVWNATKGVWEEQK